jgi:hypothetical protein
MEHIQRWDHRSTKFYRPVKNKDTEFSVYKNLNALTDQYLCDVELIEITEEEIEDIIVENSGDWGYINATDRLCHDINPVQLAKAITNLLKGE